ncbi:hypothetical protein LTS08_008441 [Lithohypha guttulata]|nr:hypothetical protein LTS08_008441 [Lithohypha guttulata]
MAFRGNEVPMDFEFQNSQGPIDPNSPFTRFAMANDKKRKTDPKSIFSNPSLTSEQGPFSAFNSPGKNNYPKFGQPNGQAYLFNGKVNPVPPPSPYRNPSFTTPRKDFDIDFSSGPESSPRLQMEQEDTPDGKALPPIPIKLEPKQKRNSLANFFGKWAPPSSGKGEIKKPFSHAIEKRVHKRRRQAQTFEKQLALARKESEESTDEEDDEQTPVKKTTSRKKQKKDLPPLPPQEVGLMTSLFTFIHTYPDAPSIIAKYLQVFFNAVIFGGVLFMFYSFYATIRADVDKAGDDAYQEMLAEITACHRHYIDNRCNAANRLPALEGPCSNWELCMNRDANAVRRARLSAHTFAEIFNSFVEPISLKTMVFTVVIVGLALLINNATFSLYRRSQEQHMHEAYRAASGQYGGMPPPGQHGMGQFPMTPGLPYQTPQQLGWQGQGQGQIDYQQSPSKARNRDGSPEKKRLMLEH